MKDYEVLIRINKDYAETLKETNIYEKYDKDSNVAMFVKLDYAKKAVEFCLKHSTGCVDMHGLEYWASEVERLRKELKELI